MTKRKKITKLRGSKTCGWGAKKKHRGSGSQGGAGRSGWKHRKLMLMRSPKDRRRFKSMSQRGLSRREKALNIDDMLRKAAGKEEVSLAGLGYQKLLARGEVSRAITVKAASFSPRAKEKIEEAGGKALEE
jgi:large subunit ribosomal protein L15